MPKKLENCQVLKREMPQPNFPSVVPSECKPQTAKRHIFNPTSVLMGVGSMG